MYRVAIIVSHNRLQLSGILRNIDKGRFGVSVLNRKQTSTTSTTSSAVVANRVTHEPFLNGSSSVYVEEMYDAWLQDPKSVHKSWDTFFRNASANAEPGLAHHKSPMLFPLAGNLPAISSPKSIAHEDTHRAIDDHLSVQAIIRSYQVCPYLPSDTPIHTNLKPKLIQDINCHFLCI